MHIKRPHQILSIYISKSFLGLAISGLLASLGLRYKFQQGSLFLKYVTRQHVEVLALCDLGKKLTFIKHCLHASVCIILHLSLSTLFSFKNIYEASTVYMYLCGPDELINICQVSISAMKQKYAE